MIYNFEPQTSCVKRDGTFYCATTLFFIFILEHGLPFHNLNSEKYFLYTKKNLYVNVSLNPWLVWNHRLYLHSMIGINPVCLVIEL